MESKQQAPSVILELMGLDKVPTQHPVIDKQKVLSENYLQKVSSIGVRKKRSSHQHHSLGMNTDEKEESEDVLKVVKALRRGKHHNPSKGNGKENPSSCENSHLADGLLQEIFYPKSMKVYPEMRDRKKIPYHMNIGKRSSRSFSKISEEISMQSGNVANRVLDTASSSFFRRNEAFANDMLKPASNISVDEIPCNSPFFCSDGSYVGFEAMNKTLEQRDVTENFRELGRCGQDCTHNQLPLISEHGNGAKNLTHRSGYSNDRIKRNIRCKVGVNYSFARRVPRPLCAASVIADNCGILNQDILFRRYWGLTKNASANWSSWKSKNQNINQKECLEDVNLIPGQEKSPSFSSCFNNNHTEDNCIGHTSEKRCYGNNLSDKITIPPQLSSSSPSPALLDNKILQERCLMNDEVKNKKYEDTNMSKQNVVSPDLSVEFLGSDATTEVVVRSHNNPTKHQSKSTAFILSQEIDSLSHASYASKQQDTSDFQEDSVHSLCSEADPDSLGSFEEVYEPSPISVLDHLFGEDIPFSSKCGDHVYDSSEVDDEEFGLNVSSDEDCGNESVGDSQENKDIAGLFRAEESRDFSYVVEVLTEAGICNRSLFTDFSTWHSAECPISPSVFEILEKKFGEQQLWKRSERKLLFDRINLGLLEILQPYLYIPMWEKPMSRRLNAEPSQDMIEEEMWGLLVAQEKKAGKELADNMLGGEIRWIELVEDVEDIVREIVKLLIEELANEIVSLENF
ncbi:hypothetical protein E2542_SST07769 [Spatholobus suberectus]|nr:hypothetical protein E2542_SST07769 [Spatholobus suberectus]